MAEYSVRVADRIGGLLDGGKFVVLLGGECSNLLGPAVALKRRGRYGVVYLDGHSDFRTVDNDAYVGAAGGEALALVTGRGQADLTDLEGLGPYVRDTDAVMLGYREDEAYLDSMREAGIRDWSALEVIKDPGKAAADVVEHLQEADGFWVHLDVDILDAEVMPAVDSPDPGGLQHEHLRELLRTLVQSPKCVGLDVGIFDPDLDPDGRYAAELTDTLVAALS